MVFVYLISGRHLLDAQMMTVICFVQSAGQAEHRDMTIKHPAQCYHCQHRTASNILASDKNITIFGFKLILEVDFMRPYTLPKH